MQCINSGQKNVNEFYFTALFELKSLDYENHRFRPLHLSHRVLNLVDLKS